MLKTTGSSDLAPRELGTDEVVEGSGRADETVVDSSKSSKSQRIVKSQKTSKAWEVAKVISLKESTFLTSDTRLAVTKIDPSRNLVRNSWYSLQELEALLESCKPVIIASDSSEIRKVQAPIRFAGPRSSLNPPSASIIGKAKRVELLMLCHVFLQ